MTALSPYLWLLFIVYTIVGWYLVRNFPIKEHKENTIETILLWPLAYGKHLSIIFKFHGSINEPILKYYLMEEWDKLLLRVPVWTKKTSGDKVVLFRVIQAKVYEKSMDFPPFTGFAADMKIGRSEINRLSSCFTYAKDDFGYAKWYLPFGMDSDVTAYTGDIIVLDAKAKEKFVHGVIDVKDLKQYIPW